MKEHHVMYYFDVVCGGFVPLLPDAEPFACYFYWCSASGRFEQLGEKRANQIRAWRIRSRERIGRWKSKRFMTRCQEIAPHTSLEDFRCLPAKLFNAL